MGTPLNGLQEAERAQFESIIDLQPGEQLIRVIRRTKASYFLPHIIHCVYFWVILTLVYSLVFIGFKDAIALWVLDFISAMLYYAILAWCVAFSIILGVGISFVRGHFYFVTSKKVVLYRQFIRILFREIDFKRITDLVLRQSLWGRLANFGTLFPVTAGVEYSLRGMEVFSIEGVRDVFEIRKLILSEIKKIQDELRQRYRAGTPESSKGGVS